MQRGVGQHDADAAHVRRNGGRQDAARCEHHDGPFGGGQDGGFRIGNTGDAPAVSRSGTMIASDLCGRHLRSRSRAMASALVASQTR